MERPGFDWAEVKEIAECMGMKNGDDLKPAASRLESLGWVQMDPSRRFIRLVANNEDREDKKIWDDPRFTQ